MNTCRVGIVYATLNALAVSNPMLFMLRSENLMIKTKQSSRHDPPINILRIKIYNSSFGGTVSGTGTYKIKIVILFLK